MSKKILPAIYKYADNHPFRSLKRRLLEVWCRIDDGPKMALPLCSQCLAKRKKQKVHWNRSSNYHKSKDGQRVYHGTHAPSTWYSTIRVIEKFENVQCMDCKWRYK